MRKKLGRFSVVIDANEYTVGNTWVFSQPTSVKSLLRYGCDYTVRGLVGTVGVERKAWHDYVRCIGKGWPKFQKQLDKLQRNRYHCVIVEGNIDDPIHERSRMIPEAVAKMTAKVVARQVPVLFASTRAKAQRMCVYFFEETIRRIQDGT